MNGILKQPTSKPAMITPLNSVCNSGAHIPAQPSLEGANRAEKSVITHNYTGQDKRPRRPRIVPHIRETSLQHLSITKNSKTVSLPYHPTFCVRVRRWLCAFRFDCLSCCDAFPSISSTPPRSPSLFSPTPLPLFHSRYSYSIKTTSQSLQ